MNAMSGTLRAFVLVVASSALASLLYLRLHAVHAYTVPPQHGDELGPVSLILTIHENPVDDEWAPIVSDILPAEKGSPRTWTTARPHLRFRIEETDRWMFCLHFATPGQVLKRVGPQTIEIAINGVVVK